MIRNDDLVDEILDGYRITAAHSSSIFSTTFLGESTAPMAPCQHVLIKVLSIVDRYTQQDILQKLYLLQKLHHPYILPILSLGTYDDAPYIITEYMQAESLHQRLQGRTTAQVLQMTVALRTLAQIGQALQYAHEQQIIHGYLRPQNVLFTIQDEVRLTGFHCHILQLPSELEDDNNLDAAIYCAPEQFAGQTNEKSDQYTLACIAYELFTDSKPFMIPSVNKPGTYYRTKSLIAPERLNPALPSYISTAILKAMSREPDQRYHDIASFLAALRIPLARSTRDLHNTLLPDIMLEVPNLPLTPQPEIALQHTTKNQMPLDLIAAKDEKTTNIDMLTQLLTNAMEPVELRTPARVLLDVSSGYMSQEDEITFKVHLPDGMISQPLLLHAGKRSRSNPQRTLIIIMGLVACIMLFTTILIALSFAMSPKQSGTSPIVHGTSVVPSSMPTPTPAGPVATQPNSPPPPPSIANSSPGQGTLPPPTPISNPGSSGFLQGVSNISSSQAQFWFAPNGWTASNMIMHYTSAGQVQQNVQMLFNNTTGAWEHTVSNLSPAQSIIYWFTYQQNRMQYTSGTYTYMMSAGAPTPVPPQPTPTPVNCASSHTEGARSLNASQGLFWFSSCGWMSGYVIVHYTGTGQAQQNIQMSYINSGAGQWQYIVSGLNARMTLTYWFTYQQYGTQYDSATYTWVHPGK